MRPVVQGDADARSDGDVAAGQSDRSAQALEDALGNREDRLHAAEHVEQDDEFVATVPRHDVPGPYRTLELTGDGAEQLIAEHVAEAVVDRLEAVEIHEQHGEPIVASLR